MLCGHTALGVVPCFPEFCATPALTFGPLLDHLQTPVDRPGGLVVNLEDY